MEYLSLIVFHTVILKRFEYERKLRNLATFLYKGRSWNEVSIIDSIPHCRTDSFENKRK